jgi:hypothetical protein
MWDTPRCRIQFLFLFSTYRSSPILITIPQAFYILTACPDLALGEHLFVDYNLLTYKTNPLTN